MKPKPIFAREAIAARLLDIKPTQLRALVDAGHLPRPCRIGEIERFDMEELARIVRGDQIGGGGMEW